MRKTALYARCSTADQHPDAQLHELRDYARRRRIDAVACTKLDRLARSVRGPGALQVVRGAAGAGVYGLTEAEMANQKP